MFLEVHAMKRSDCSAETVISKEPENRHLFEVTGIHIRHSKQFPNHAEIVTANSVIYLAIDSYENICKRITKIAGISSVIA